MGGSAVAVDSAVTPPCESGYGGARLCVPSVKSGRLPPCRRLHDAGHVVTLYLFWRLTMVQARPKAHEDQKIPQRVIRGGDGAFPTSWNITTNTRRTAARKGAPAPTCPRDAAPRDRPRTATPPVGSAQARVGMTFRHDCLAEIKFKRSAVPLDEALETAEKLSRFVTFCVGFHASVSEVDVVLEGQREKVRLFRQMLCWKTPSEYQLLHIPFTYRSIEDQIEELLNSWMNASAELAKARDILISLMAYDWRMPIDVSFVTTSQALEALSRHNVELKAMEESAFERRKAQIKVAIRDIDADTRYWVMGRIGENRKGQDRLLKELLDRYTAYVCWLVPDMKAFVKDQVAARNWYSHRRSGPVNLSGLELVHHTQLVQMLLYGIVWMKIGLDSVSLIDQLKKTGYKTDVIARAREKYDLASSCAASCDSSDDCRKR